MTRNIEWLKEEIGTEMIQLEPNRKERWSDVKYQTLRSVAQKIGQLDEPEKVIVPSFVAEYFEKFKHDLEIGIYCLNRELTLGGFEHDSEIHKWANHRKNKPIETLIRMKDGYAVEEKKYHVLDKEGCVLLKKYISGTSLIMTTGIKPERFPEWQQNDLTLTEQEIKDYDPRYMAFAEPVTP